MRRLALALVTAAALSATVPAHATIRYCSGVVDVDCFYSGRQCAVYFSGFAAGVTKPPPLCL